MNIRQKTTVPYVPIRTAMFDDAGNLTRPWILFFEQAATAPGGFPLDFTGQTLTGRTFAAGDGFPYDLASFLDTVISACIFTGRFTGAIWKRATLDATTVLGNPATRQGYFLGADFSDAILTGTTIWGDFTGVNFSGAVLAGVTGSTDDEDFNSGGNFIAASFVKATLTDCSFEGRADFAAADFTDASIGGSSKFHFANFAACAFRHTTFDGTGKSLEFTDANFAGCRFLTNASMTVVNFQRANFRGAHFDSCSAITCDFSSADLGAATMISADLTGSAFAGADLSHARFLGCFATTGSEPTFTGAVFTGTLFVCPDLGPGLTPLGSLTGAVLVLAVDHTAKPWDCNRLFSFTAAKTLTLPDPAISDTWEVAVQNTSAGVVVIDPGALTIDGAAGVLNLAAGDGLRILCDGTNYFTQR